MLAFERPLFEPAQRSQPQVKDRLGLDLRELERAHQDRFGLVLLAHDLDHPVEVAEDDEDTGHDLQAAFDLAQPMPRAPHQHLVAVVEEGLQDLRQVHHGRPLAAVENVHVEADPHLEVGVAEGRLHEHLGIDGAAARLEHQAYVLARFVAHVGDQPQASRGDELGDLLDQPRFLHLKRDLGDDDAILAAPEAFGVPPRAQPETAAPGGVGGDDGLGVLGQDAARGQIGAGHQRHQLAHGGVGVLDEVQERVAHLGGVVRRDAGRHAHRDPGGAVRQKVGEVCGQDQRLALAAVVGLAEVDRVLVDAVQQRFGHRGEPCLGVAHGGGVIAIDVAEVALSLDQAVAHREALGEPNQRLVHRLVAVRMVLADDVADDARALLEARPGIEPSCRMA